MKKNISYPAVMTGLFCAFLGLGAALSVFMPRRTFSETENRYLAKRPALTWEAVKSGKFGSDYEIYLSDQFPFRDSWIGFKTAAEKIQLKKEINGVFLGKDGYLIEAFYAEDMDPELSKKNLDALAAFALRQEALLGDGHVKVLLAPTASEILTEKLPASASPFSQAAATDFLEKAGLSSMLVRGTGNSHPHCALIIKSCCRAVSMDDRTMRIRIPSSPIASTREGNAMHFKNAPKFSPGAVF